MKPNPARRRNANPAGGKVFSFFGDLCLTSAAF
jgi:hypothetical protein